MTGGQALIRLNELYRTAEQSQYFPPITGDGCPGEFYPGVGGRWNGISVSSSRPPGPANCAAIFSSAPECKLPGGCSKWVAAPGPSFPAWPLGAAIHGLDLEPARLAEARRHAPQATLACANALWLPYASGVFDITFCHFLLLWVRDPLQALREMKRVTRPGGSILALAEPDYNARVDKPDELASLGRWQAESLRRQGARPGPGEPAAGVVPPGGHPADRNRQPAHG